MATQPSSNLKKKKKMHPSHPSGKEAGVFRGGGGGGGGSEGRGLKGDWTDLPPAGEYAFVNCLIATSLFF